MNIYQLKMLLFYYAKENEGLFPSISSTPGTLTFSADFIQEMGIPKEIMICPFSGKKGALDSSYFYFGFPFSKADEFKIVAENIKNYWDSATMEKANPKEKRLRLDACNTCNIPVLIERPPSLRFHQNSHVLFLDGTIKEVNRGEWPLTDEVLSIIRELEKGISIGDAS